MSKFTTAFAAFGAAAALCACSYPQTTAGTVDTRPGIAIQTSLDASEMPVFVDGQYVGRAIDFKAGKAQLRILPGTHVIRVIKPNRQEYSERIYAGDGTVKTIVIQ